MKKFVSLIFAASLLSMSVTAQDAFHEQSNQTVALGQKASGLALTPQMGWSTWNKFAGNINEKVIKEMADQIVELGLAEAGYVYLNIDDCWHGERDADGFIQADPERFPSGIKALADYVHAKGLKLGIYSDAGRLTCAGKPGSFGHEYQDALQYARWNIDYLKYDWCSSDDINAHGAYTLMRDALAASGRPIFFSMCEWGHSKPWEWAAEVGHSWRSTGDIGVTFRNNIDHGSWTQLCVLHIIDFNEPLRKYAGPGHWNDPDMLECGNGMTVAQDRSHFTLWAMMAAPLILGNDLSNMTDEVYRIITNKDVIAIDQDPLGIQGLRHSTENGVEFWFKPMTDGRWAVTLFNRNEHDASIDLDWQKFNFTDELSGLSTSFDTKIYSIKDAWGNAPRTLTTTQKKVKVEIPMEDVVTLILTPSGVQPSFSINPGSHNWLYDSKKPVVVDFTATNPADKAVSGKYTLTLTTDKHKKLKTLSKSVSLKAGEEKVETFNLGKLAPGFYTLTLSKDGGSHKTFNIGVDPDKVISATDRQPDFEEFWNRARAELAAVAPDYQLELLPEKCTNDGLVYKVTMNSLGGHRLQCFLSVPKSAGKHPVFISFNGYSSTAWIPTPNPNYCELNVSTRGQGDYEENIYGDWIRWNIADPEKYYYRGAFMDCVRAIDFAAQCEWIDSSKMFAQGGSQGGALTFAAASLDNRLCAIAPDVPFLGDYPDYFQIVDWPASAVFAAQKEAGLSDTELYRNLSYFDIKNLTPWITCPVVMAFGLQDPTCPPHTNFASFNNIPHNNKTWHVFPLTGHAMWLEPEWNKIRDEFFRPFLKDMLNE